MKREAIVLANQLHTDSFDETTDAFDIIQTADLGFQKIQEKVLSGTETSIESIGAKVLEQHAETKRTGVLGEKTGLAPIDATMLGLVSPDLTILAARPGQGKTALALSITRNITINNKVPGAWFSLEMDSVQLVRRLASMEAEIDHKRIRQGNTSVEEDSRLLKSIERIVSSPLYIDDRAGVNERYVKARTHLLKKKHGIKYVVIDYLQLMSGVETKGKSRENIVSEISRTLKNLAREVSIPIIALSQLNREVEARGSKMPQLSDLRESGSIEQDADNVIFIMRPEYYGIQSVSIEGVNYENVNGLAILDFAKNRHGSVGSEPIRFNGRYMEFTNYQEGFLTSERTKDDLPF